MSPKQPSSTPSSPATHKERILSKGYMCTEIRKEHQTIWIYKAISNPLAKAATFDVSQN